MAEMSWYTAHPIVVIASSHQPKLKSRSSDVMNSWLLREG